MDAPKTRIHGYGRALYPALKDEACRVVSLAKLHVFTNVATIIA